jgi:hypothetical protein
VKYIPVVVHFVPFWYRLSDVEPCPNEADRFRRRAGGPRPRKLSRQTRSRRAGRLGARDGRPARRRVAPSCQQEYSSTIMPARGLPAGRCKCRPGPGWVWRRAIRCRSGDTCMHACMHRVVSCFTRGALGPAGVGCDRSSRRAGHRGRATWHRACGRLARVCAAPPAAAGASATAQGRAVAVPLPWLLACQRRLRAIELYGYRPIGRPAGRRGRHHYRSWVR